MIRAITCTMLCLVLSGCPTNPASDKPLDPVIVPQRVEVGVREKCTVTLPAEPVWQVDATTQPDDLERSKAILVELEQRRDWMVKAKAAAVKCE